MNDLSQAMSVSTSGMKAQATRLRHVSENIANTDTPGYRRKMVPFEEVAKNGGVETGRVTLDQTELREVYDPSNPLANEAGFFDGSNVNMLIEVADAREAQRSYEANLKVFEQVREMSSALMDLIRR